MASKSLFISVYGDGGSQSGYTRYIQLYNPTDTVNSLNDYALAFVYGGPMIVNEHEEWLSFTTDAVIGSGEVYLLVKDNPPASLAVLNPDEVLDNNTPFRFNGDDGIKLVKVYQGIVFNLSSSISGRAFFNNHWNRLIISSGITFGVI